MVVDFVIALWRLAEAFAIEVDLGIGGALANANLSGSAWVDNGVDRLVLEALEDIT